MSIIYPSSETATTVNRAVKNVMGTTKTTDGAVSDGLIISENLQPVVECTPGMDYKITDKTITGAPPLSFHAIAQHLFDWSLDGNTDSGDSVGNKTANLFDLSDYYSVTPGVTNIVINNGIITYNASSQYLAICYRFNLAPSDTVTIELGEESVNVQLELRLYNGETQVGTRIVIQKGNPYVISGSEEYDSFTIYLSNGANTGACTAYNLMLNLGNEILPYEPYGYDVPIVVNTTDTYHCYITDVLRKSDGETPVFDTMSSDGTITRRVDTDGTPLAEPTTETYTAPDITVNWGWNTIDVDTTVSPSNMIINYKDN